MVCIYCGSPTQVTNSRLQKGVNQIWRRRHCLACSSDFTTHEIIDLGSTIAVRNPSHNIEPFSRDKLFISIMKACQHRESAISDAAALTQTVIVQLRQSVKEGMIEIHDIKQAAQLVLSRFDNTALTVYKAYHP